MFSKPVIDDLETLRRNLLVLRVGFTTFTFVVLAGLALGWSVPALAVDRKIVSVKVSHSFFNPSLRESVSLAVKLASAGSLTGVVLDRDGYVVRTLQSAALPQPGTLLLTWDGRNEKGMVVPDEAYSFKLVFTSGPATESYFPASVPGAFNSLKTESYDRQSGALRYTLPKASRVHVQAGSARVNSKTGETTGPVLKTIVNRSPRIAGSVIESWAGFDESGTIYVPELPDFVVAIAATALPENSVITVGNRRETFTASVAKRAGTSLLPPVHATTHHGGLTTIDDIAPALVSVPAEAIWSEPDKTWVLTDHDVRLMMRLEGFNAAEYSRQPGRVMVFVGQQKVYDAPAGPELDHLTVRLPDTLRGDAILAVNWVSDHGPVAVTSFRIRTSS